VRWPPLLTAYICITQDYVECLHHRKEIDRMNTIMREAIKQEKAKLKAEGKPVGFFAEYFYN
jgi:hypothetical protein